jgi:hypothetical protein
MQLFMQNQRSCNKTNAFLGVFEGFLVARNAYFLQTACARSTNKERKMSVLNGLKLVASKRPQQPSPVVTRRHKLSKQIHEQQQLATAMAEGGTYAPVRLRLVKDKHTGERKNIESAKRIKPWWFTAENGRVCLQVRYGTRVLDLAKGKNSIEVSNANELIAVLKTLQTAVDAGELDVQIDSASAAVRERFKQ